MCSSDLDKSTRSLRRLPATVRHGLIWAIMDPLGDRPGDPARDRRCSAIEVADFLGGIDEDLAALDLGSHRFFRQHARKRATNWKLVMDAFHEIYHIKRLHARTIAPFFSISNQPVKVLVAIRAFWSVVIDWPTRDTCRNKTGISADTRH